MSKWKKYIGTMAISLDLDSRGQDYFYYDKKSGGTSVEGFDKWTWEFSECDEDSWDEVIVGGVCLARW
jgi:hypothetical protein